MAITLRGVKGSKLTHDELDANFTTLEGDTTALAATVSNVDNTSDASKASSGPIKDALDLKVDQAAQDIINDTISNNHILCNTIAGQNAAVFNLLRNEVFNYKIYVPKTYKFQQWYVSQVGRDAPVTGQRRIILRTGIDAGTAEVIEFKEVVTDSVSQDWILLKGNPLTSVNVYGYMKMSRTGWLAIGDMAYTGADALFRIHRDSLIEYSEVSSGKEYILDKPTYNGVEKRIPNFYQKWKTKTDDLNVVVWGDSLSVRTTNNSAFSDPTRRGPLLTANNWASAVWDKVKWGQELFFRFDANGLDASPKFVESGGTFVTVVPNAGNTPSQGINDNVWDDFSKREGITRMYVGNANVAVTFKMVGATVDKEGSLDFIYRTDLAGSTSNTVTIAEGNGLVRVWNGTAWVEANGYNFSMRHAPVSTYAGTTKFGERLKFKAVQAGSPNIDSRNTTKNITITKTDTGANRFMYWGIQTSKEAHMVRVISTGRGGLDFISMEPFTDDDLFGHDADLIVHELPINGGINVPNNSQLPTYYVDQINDWFFDAGNTRSLKNMSSNWADFEVLMWSPQTTPNVFDDDDNFLSYLKTPDFAFYGVQDNWRQIAVFLSQNEEAGFYFVDMFEKWLLESVAIYGRKDLGFEASSITSDNSFTGDGIHQNDFGIKIMKKHILTALDFNQ